MRMLLVSAALFGLIACTTANGPPADVADQETVGHACVDGSGHFEAARCTVKVPSKNALGFCQCGPTAQLITAPLCAGPDKPPVETDAYRRAVLAAIGGDGSLKGDHYNDKPMCILPRQT